MGVLKNGVVLGARRCREFSCCSFLGDSPDDGMMDLLAYFHALLCFWCLLLGCPVRWIVYMIAGVSRGFPMCIVFSLILAVLVTGGHFFGGDGYTGHTLSLIVCLFPLLVGACGVYDFTTFALVSFFSRYFEMVL